METNLAGSEARLETFSLVTGEADASFKKYHLYLKVSPILKSITGI